MSNNPFEEYDYIPAQKHVEEGWDCNPRRPPSQVSLLWNLVTKHFPNYKLETRIEKNLLTFTAEHWVAECDDTITRQCAELAIISDEFDADNFERFSEFQHQTRPTVIFRKKLKAIETNDLSLWQEARRTEDSRVRDLETQAAEQLGIDGMSISDVLNVTIGPAYSEDQPKVDFWARQHAVISLALKSISKGGRPASSYKDEAVRAVVGLWETLSGKTAVQPSHKAGSSERANSMVPFVTEAIEIYSDFGLKGAISGNSGAFWKRILS